MDFDVQSDDNTVFIAPFPLKCLSWALIFITVLLLWKLGTYVREVATTTSGIHYVNRQRRHLPIVTSCNPFYFKGDYSTASLSGVKCVMKCDGTCNVQALWGVPIYSLFELLNKDWSYILNSVTSIEPSEKFSTKCAFASNPFELVGNVKKILEFKFPSHFDGVLSEGVMRLQETYPLVVLMVLRYLDHQEQYRDPLVIACANVFHLSHNALDRPQLIGKIVKVRNGYVGQLKKVYHTSPTEGRLHDLCLICYHRPVSVVQLACRHACLCRSCYEKCDKCPLCRNACMDFFELPDVLPESDESSVSEED